MGTAALLPLLLLLLLWLRLLLIRRKCRLILCRRLWRRRWRECLLPLRLLCLVTLRLTLRLCLRLCLRVRLRVTLLLLCVTLLLLWWRLCRILRYLDCTLIVFPPVSGPLYVMRMNAPPPSGSRRLAWGSCPG